MNSKTLLTCAFVIACASICVAQVPAKKTELTVADREAWHKVLRWPVELASPIRRAGTRFKRL